MLTITARNVNDAWHWAKIHLNNRHVVRPSRVGEVWEHPDPVTTEYQYPAERVLFDPRRNANPIFHFMEALWMLAGRNDVAWLAQFNSRMREFSDDGLTFHGAYGYRWREHFDMLGGGPEGFSDQLPKVARMLRNSSDERRAVLCMWDPAMDLDRPEIKDIPCNDIVFFKIRQGHLSMTVCCRSNDIVWGAYGSNVVHFSMLLEYMAGMVGVPVGVYWQVSDSWHAYTARWEEYGGRDPAPTSDYYTDGTANPYPMVESAETWDRELDDWMGTTELGSVRTPLYRNSFFPLVATPLLQSWRAYRAGDLHLAVQCASQCAATDWSLAAVQWLERIAKRRAAKPVEASV